MASILELPSSRVWADRAEECRAMAASFHNRETRERMLNVAQSYDRMAVQAAQRELAEADRVDEAKP